MPFIPQGNIISPGAGGRGAEIREGLWLKDGPATPLSQLEPSMEPTLAGPGLTVVTLLSCFPALGHLPAPNQIPFYFLTSVIGHDEYSPLSGRFKNRNSLLK